MVLKGVSAYFLQQSTAVKSATHSFDLQSPLGPLEFLWIIFRIARSVDAETVKLLLYPNSIYNTNTLLLTKNSVFSITLHPDSKHGFNFLFLFLFSSWFNPHPYIRHKRYDRLTLQIQPLLIAPGR